MDAEAQGILDFWLDEVGPDGWYRGSDALDATIRARYGDLWEVARASGRDAWRNGPHSCLALVILLDQFPRNMFRGDPRSFASDARALAVAKGAVERGQDSRIAPAAREFFYLPMRHSEVLADQSRSVGLMLLNYGPGEALAQARAHRWVIRRFGRFPYRNAALGRRTTPAEQAFLDAGGYRAAMAAVGASPGPEALAPRPVSR